jgi:hypothetical protein
MSGHAEHGGGGDMATIALAKERIVPLGNLLVDAAVISIAGVLGFLFMFLRHVDPNITQSGKMDGGGHAH